MSGQFLHIPLQEILACQSANNAWTKAQLWEWGVPWLHPHGPPKGWKAALAAGTWEPPAEYWQGKPFTQTEEFERTRNIARRKDQCVVICASGKRCKNRQQVGQICKTHYKLEHGKKPPKKTRKKFKHDLAAYWKTPRFKRVRKFGLLLMPDCYVQCGRPSQTVHHTSYDNIAGPELLELEDCLGVCNDCHDRAYRMRKELGLSYRQEHTLAPLVRRDLGLEQ